MVLFLWLSAWTAAMARTDDTEVEELKSLGWETVSPTERMDMIATSVGKKRQRISASASAIYVISQEDIRRNGVTSLPEALRLAPGVQAARIDSNQWAISTRGFNGMFANKLLVLVDGREVYNPPSPGCIVRSRVSSLPRSGLHPFRHMSGAPSLPPNISPPRKTLASTAIRTGSRPTFR